MSLAEELRDVIEEFYRSGTPEGRRLAAIADRMEQQDRQLLEAFLARLARTGALSVPPADLTAAVDDTLEEQQ